MPWELIVMLVMKIIEFIMERRKGERHAFFARLREAKRCAVESGDCSRLQALHDELEAAKK